MKDFDRLKMQCDNVRSPISAQCHIINVHPLNRAHIQVKL